MYVHIKIMVLWCVTPPLQWKILPDLWGVFFLQDGSIRFLSHVGIHLSQYKASHKNSLYIYHHEKFKSHILILLFPSYRQWNNDRGGQSETGVTKW